jgi:hypothetical protein
MFPSYAKLNQLWLREFRVDFSVRILHWVLFDELGSQAGCENLGRLSFCYTFAYANLCYILNPFEQSVDYNRAKPLKSRGRGMFVYTFYTAIFRWISHGYQCSSKKIGFHI